MPPTPRWRSTGLLLLAAACAGSLLGLGGATFRYAEGLSYLSADPAACTNCHIMQSQYDSWQKASHHTAAVCVDCHLPADFFGKYLAKGVNGWNHSRGFTLQDFPEPIRITPHNAAILQANCVRCHEGLTHGLGPRAGGSRSDGCVHCHGSVGHGELVGLGGPWRRSEKEAGSDG